MRLHLTLALVLGISGLLWAQETAPTSPPSTGSEAKGEEQNTDAQKADDGSTPTKKQRKRFKNPLSDLCIHVGGSPCYDVSKKKPEETGQKSEEKPQTAPTGESVPRSDSGAEGEYSSSRDTLAIMNGVEGKEEPTGKSEVTELKHYDPHQAEKDIEVGEFYLKRKNYKAAIYRFRSALENKPNYALAIFRLAQALEPTGEVEEARGLYERYLQILPNGELAAEAHKALERLQPRPEKAATSPPAQTPR
ncbi:MAG TPA: tetratricopeptide repeat protein [Terriglobales bacterium]|nr:tetratricopeptide repeat protein [Terriglobales bacterium]